METRQPHLMRKVFLDGAWRKLPVQKTGASGRTGAATHDLSRVLYRGQPVVVTDGTFYIEYREDGRRRLRAIGSHPRDVKAALATQASVLALRRQGVEAGDAPQLRMRPPAAGPTLRHVVEGFIAAPPLAYRRRTYLKYRNALTDFAAWTKRTRVAEIDRAEILAWIGYLVRGLGRDPRTAKNKGVVVVKVLRDAGAPIEIRKGDWPRSTERQRGVYEAATLERLFAACTPAELALYRTFLLTGMRDQEVRYLEWKNLDAKRSTLAVRKKPGFDPKSYHEREVPIPAALLRMLLEHRRTLPADAAYLFPTRERNRTRGLPGGQPDRHQLARLKRVALRAGLNCGQCETRIAGKVVTCASAAVCRQFFLHKFRHTYATALLHDGVDLLSLQKLLGHRDLASTQKYLRALEPAELLSKISGSSLAKRFA